jgi:hypothetical protein
LREICFLALRQGVDLDLPAISKEVKEGVDYCWCQYDKDMEREINALSSVEHIGQRDEDDNEQPTLHDGDEEDR